MSKRVSASGSLTIQSDTAVIGTGQDVEPLSLGPGGGASGEVYYQAEAHSQPVIATAGLVGSIFQDLDALDGLTQIELLWLRTSAEIALRLYAIPASLQAVVGSFPTGFGGGETCTITIDGTAVLVTFDILDQSAAQCAARINAACAIFGLATPRATVVSGQLRIDGIATAVLPAGIGQITVTPGAPAITLGIDSTTSPTTEDAQGSDIYLGPGVFGPCEFPKTGSNLLTKVQVSGQATLNVRACGRSS